MARYKDNYVTQGLSGKVGNEFVFKNYNGKTIVGKYPDRSQVTLSKEQIKYKKLFAEASKYASKIINDPLKKNSIKTKGATSVYHAALKDYIARHAGKPRNGKQVKADINGHLNQPDLNSRQIKVIRYMAKTATITNAVYQRVTGASKPTATRDLQQLVRLNIFNPPKTKGAGACYTLRRL